MKKNIFLVLLILLIFVSCSRVKSPAEFQKELNIDLVDSNATFETSALYYHLRNFAEQKIIFGHHHATAYGIGWKDEEGRSDVKDVSGSHPGLIGWDFLDLPQGDSLAEAKLKQRVIKAHSEGIVNIFAWHMQNLVTGENFYDTTVVVKHIIPGGSHHEVYKKELDRIADFVNQLKDKKGKLIPIIFRPFHEFDGSWFWWGKNFCTREEFISMWKFTVEHLRDVKKLRNLIYAFSPDRMFHSEEEYLDRYPGDEYVDLLGTDNYWDFKPEGEGLDAIIKKLKIVSQIAEKKNKIAAFTETGSETIPDSLWWTDKLLHVMKQDSVKLSFVMVWRNAHPGHFYAPHKGHPSNENFLEFKNDPTIVFADELPDLYNIDIKLSK